MAVAFDWQNLGTSSPAVYGKCEYDSYRSGNNMYYKIYARMGCIYSGSSAYRNNRWACKIWVNGTLVANNATVKPATSGTIGSTVYTYTTDYIAVPVNSGTISVVVQFADTGGGNTWYNAFWGEYSGAMAVESPTGPSAPASISIPSAIAPDKIAGISWNASSGGTNGVSGYVLAWSKDGGNNYTEIDVGNVTSYNLNLNSLGFVQNSVLKVRVIAYSIVNGTKYYSAWTYSGSTTTVFVAPSNAKNPSLVVVGTEPILTSTYRATWQAPDSGGTNGVGGYILTFYKNNVLVKTIDVGNVLTYDFLLSNIDTFDVGDTIRVGIQSYTIGQSVKYYVGAVIPAAITIVSDKYIFVSIDGGSFIKYKMFISINGGSFSEIKKEKFSTIV